MSSGYSASTLNTLFSQHLDTTEGKEKLAAAGASYIRERLRETAVSRKILPPEQVTKADCQRSVDHEGLVKIVDIEPQSSAMALNFRAEPDGRFISAPRFELPFFTISSERFQKTEQELQSYEMPITKVIEQNSVKDIQAIEDARFIQAARLATTGTQKILADNQVGITGKPDLVELFDQLDDDRLAVGTIVMTKSQFNKWVQLDNTEIGDVLASEVAKDGYRYNTILGHKLVTTIKTDIFSPREMWVFSEPDFLGKFYILNNTKFYVDKRANMIEWQAWEDIAVGFGNVRSMARKIFTSALENNVTGGASSLAGLGSFTYPGDEAALNDPGELGIVPLDEGVTWAK
jgi:hypothetical protein